MRRANRFLVMPHLTDGDVLLTCSCFFFSSVPITLQCHPALSAVLALSLFIQNLKSLCDSFTLKVAKLTTTTKDGVKTATLDAMVMLYFLGTEGKHKRPTFHRTAYHDSCTAHKINTTPKHYVSLIAGSPTAAPLKLMASSEPNSVQEEAIFQIQVLLYGHLSHTCRCIAFRSTILSSWIHSAVARHRWRRPSQHQRRAVFIFPCVQPQLCLPLQN